MITVALILCVCIAAVCAIGIVSPPRLMGMLKRVQTPTGLYCMATLRVVMGTAIYFGAPDSRAPQLLSILGIVIFASGVLTPLVGLDRFRRLTDWSLAQGSAFMRVCASVGFTALLWLAHAIAP